MAGTTKAPPATASAIQATRWPRSVGRHEIALAPAQNTSGLRGSSDGVSEKPKKTSAPTIAP